MKGKALELGLAEHQTEAILWLDPGKRCGDDILRATHAPIALPTPLQCYTQSAVITKVCVGTGTWESYKTINLIILIMNFMTKSYSWKLKNVFRIGSVLAVRVI